MDKLPETLLTLAPKVHRHVEFKGIDEKLELIARLKPLGFGWLYAPVPGKSWPLRVEIYALVQPETITWASC